MRKKLLVLHPHLPYPPSQGADIRNYHLLRWLADRFEVDLACFSDDPAPPDSPIRSMVRHLIVRPFPTRGMAERLISTFFSPKPDMALRLFDQSMLETIVSAARETDYAAVHVEGIEMVPYGIAAIEELQRRSVKVRLIFDDHNAEYMLQRSAFLTDARHPLRLPGAIYSLIQWKKLKRYERAACSLAWKVIAVSRKDAEAIESLLPGMKVAVIPNGVDVSHYREFRSGTKPSAPTLVFTGKMDYRPNVDAMLWFTSEIWPHVRREFPNARLLIVGQKPHPKLAELAEMPRIELTGFVPDVRPFVALADVFVVPLRMGSGTRLKILQAMAMGKAIVSTEVGAEGLGVTHGEELLLADDPRAFAQAVIELLKDDSLRERLGKSAQDFVARHFDWSVIVPKLEKAYEGIL